MNNKKYHGDTDSTEYRSWLKMKERCYDKNNPFYMDYGGRGIIVCERWVNNYPMFLLDMGRKPSKYHSLDRFPNNDGNYEPENCRWATKLEQANNKRNNRIFFYNGESKNLKQWSIVKNLSYKLVHKRINTFGWTISEALETPIKREKRYLYGY